MIREAEWVRIAKYARWKGVGGCTAWRAGSFEFGAHALEGQPPDICKSYFRAFFSLPPTSPRGESADSVRQREIGISRKRNRVFAQGGTTCVTLLV